MTTTQALFYGFSDVITYLFFVIAGCVLVFVYMEWQKLQKDTDDEPE